MWERTADVAQKSTKKKKTLLFPCPRGRWAVDVDIPLLTAVVFTEKRVPLSLEKLKTLPIGEIVTFVRSAFLVASETADRQTTFLLRP